MNMKLTISGEEYELIEINNRKYISHSEDLQKYFDGVSCKPYDAYMYNSIVINNKFYAPRLIQKEE